MVIMKVGLVSYECKNNDVIFNLFQIQKAMQECDKDTDILCFGEAFLQGFDVLSNVYEEDVKIAIAQDSAIMHRIKQWTLDYHVGVMFGYIEKNNESLYSSYIFLDEGKVIHHYRRISKGWKEYDKTDKHYKEGKNTSSFHYKGYNCNIALCGDLWVYPDRFTCEDVLFWPIYVNFDEKLWQEEKAEYAKQSLRSCKKAVLINSISKDPDAIGGAFYFEEGEIKKELSFNKEEILYVKMT